MPIDVLETPTKRVLPGRAAVKAVIVHTSGSTDLDAIISWYTRPDGRGPHYLIETTGTIRRFASEDYVAYHCAITPERARLYQLGYQEWSHWIGTDSVPLHRMGDEYSGYRQWRDQWASQGVSSPLQLITGERPNAVSVGVELQQPVDPGPRIFNDAQYAQLASLLADIWMRRQLPLDRLHVLGHYDCDPIHRCNAAGGTDPGRMFDWNYLWDRLRGR